MLKKYVRPSAELIVFEDKSKIYMASTCNCDWGGAALIRDNWEGTGQTESCSVGSFYASDNPFEMAAPLFGSTSDVSCGPTEICARA